MLVIWIMIRGLLFRGVDGLRVLGGGFFVYMKVEWR
jgi:hypothetical protein